MATINYIAKKDFKYDGKLIRAGTEWKPGGNKYDAQIVDFLVNPIVKKVVSKRRKANVAKRK